MFDISEFDIYDAQRRGRFVAENEATPERKLSRLEKDRLRTVLQAPISVPMYRILYLKKGRECQSPWLYKKQNADIALGLMKKKYGERNAIIYVD